MINRESLIFFATEIDFGSRSIAISFPFFSSLDKMSLLCPPCPKVQSIYVPSLLIFNPSITSSGRTAM